jgi:hypothetical protein
MAPLKPRDVEILKVEMAELRLDGSGNGNLSVDPGVKMRRTFSSARRRHCSTASQCLVLSC